MDAEPAGGPPQPDLGGELVGLLDQLVLLSVGARLREVIAALGRQGAAEHAVVGVDPGGLTARSRQWSRIWQKVQMALASALICSQGSGKNRSGSGQRQAA